MDLNKVIKAFNEIDWRGATSMFNTVTFTGYALDEFNFSYDERLKPNEVNALRYSSYLLAIAGFHYSILDVTKPTIESDILIRYSDWLLTTPLLLMTLSSFYELSDRLTTELIVADVLMILFGLQYELTKDMKFWTLGTIAYLWIVYRLYNELPEKDLFYMYFVVGWGLYGIVSLFPMNQRIMLYTIMDNYNKLIFAMHIRSKIYDNINRRLLPATI